MARDDWFRRTTWTQADQDAFFARNKRSRGAGSKAQYMHIQAYTLLKTGDLRLVPCALELLERAFAEYPDAMDRASALDTAGQCCEALGRTEDALGFYRQALRREREFPGMRSNAGFRLAKVVVENRRAELYAEAIAAVEAHGAPIFPWHAYVVYGTRAAVAKYRGDRADARALAALALQAAAIRDTGLSHGRGHLGTVADTSTPYHQILLEIAAAQ